MPVLTVSLNETEAYTTIICTVTEDDGSCLILQKFLKRNILQINKSISRQASFKVKWGLTRSTEFKDVRNPSLKKWGPKCMRKGKEHAEHCRVSSLGPYFDIPILWKFILQAKCTNIDLPCFDLRIQIAVCYSMSHTFEYQRALMH